MKKKCLYITLRSYPFGGGESFFLQSIKTLLPFYEVVWVSFRNSKGYFLNDSETPISISGYTYLDVKLRGGLSSQNIYRVVKKYQPSVIHFLPENEPEPFNILENLDIPVIVAYHFWGSLVSNHKSPIDILSDFSLKISPLYLILLENPLFSFYVASDFMNKVVHSLGGKPISNIIYPGTLENKIVPISLTERKYITIINTHPLKGGNIFLDIVKNLNYPFIAVSSDPTPLDQEIEKHLKKNPENIFTHFTDLKEIYSKTRILLLPTLLDETFCRVAYEASQNKIPILTTGKGFISQMLGNGAIYLSENSSEWIETLEKVYNNFELLENLSSKSSESNYGFDENKFISLIDEGHSRNRLQNIMIFCPWGEQGLGIQSRLYSKILRSNEYHVHIFSYKSYYCYHEHNQCDKNEWNEYDSVYYSLNNRENVTIEEIESFIISRRIGYCLIPEIRGRFDIVKALKRKGVKVFAIPNIEIIKNFELDCLKLFDEILCPTRICFDILNQRYNCKYIGHPIYKTPKLLPTKISFLHISGYNSERKNTLKIINCFINSRREDIFLTITISGKVPTELMNIRHPRMNIVYYSLSHKEIMELYSNHSASIQISTHEGLGLGFYESIGTCTPVISINASPHNEVINKENGWLLKCLPFKLTDNPDALVEGYDCDEKELRKLFENITLEEICEKTKYLNDAQYPEFEKSFIKFFS